MKRDKEVGEHRETLKTISIMRAWLAYSHNRLGWKEWGRGKCDTKWCTCKHVVIGQDIGMYWIWVRAWKWVSGGKEKNGIEAWRRGCEGMKWRTAIRSNVLTNRWEMAMDRLERSASTSSPETRGWATATTTTTTTSTTTTTNQPPPPPPPPLQSVSGIKKTGNFRLAVVS